MPLDKITLDLVMGYALITKLALMSVFVSWFRYAFRTKTIAKYVPIDRKRF